MDPIRSPGFQLQGATLPPSQIRAVAENNTTRTEKDITTPDSSSHHADSSLSKHPSQNEPSPAPRTNRDAQARIAVMLKPSPRPEQYRSHVDFDEYEDYAGEYEDNDGSDPVVISDLSPKFDKGAKLFAQTPRETPVPLPKMFSTQQQPSRTPAKLSKPHAQSAPPTPATMNRRGRPKGWKPGMAYSAMRGNDPPRRKQVKPGTGDLPKRRGRPPRQPSPSPVEIYHKVKHSFVAFICEWVGCKAELHNLETLRRHVYVVHLAGDARACMWSKCGQKEVKPSFANLQALATHMEDSHLAAIAWHVGDGPKNQGGDMGRRKIGQEATPDYLKDADGNQVTPSVRDQELEDQLTWKANRRKLKELLIRRDANLPSDESDDSEDTDER